jgi:hypothetical protein
MNTRTSIRFALSLSILVLTACAELGMPQRPATTGQVVMQTNGRNARVGASISAGQARALAVRYNLTGYRALPPGIQRRLARGKPLPPGIARRVVPGSMLGSLPVVEGHEWRVAGTDLLLIALGTLIVVEVLGDVFE